MAEDAERHLRRATFDDVARGYEDARPVAPSEVLDDLVELARLEPGASLLEIGCGTGQATRPLTERGFSVLAVELGANLAEFARRRLADFPDVEIVTSSFEDWDPDGARFDAVVAFNSFHWLDPETRFAKPASVLRPGGALAVYGSGFVIHGSADPGWLEVVEDEATTAGFEPRHLDDVRDRSDEFTKYGHFSEVTRKTYIWDLAYDAGAYIALMASMSTFRALEEVVREELFERVRRRIDDAGGSVSPTRFDVLYVARRSSTLAVG
jgi:SAM-dependent methyltransferase